MDCAALASPQEGTGVGVWGGGEGMCTKVESACIPSKSAESCVAAVVSSPQFSAYLRVHHSFPATPSLPRPLMSSYVAI